MALAQMKWLVSALAAAWFLGLPPGAAADGYESKPERAALDPDYAAGKKAIEEKQWAEAIERLGKALVRDPDNPDLENWLGYGNRKLAKYDLAFKHYKRAIELDPRHRGASVDPRDLVCPASDELGDRAAA
jgi:tetratricopeptide (TPR) repeat protein